MSVSISIGREAKGAVEQVVLRASEGRSGDTKGDDHGPSTLMGSGGQGESQGTGPPLVTPAAAGVQQIRTVFGVTRGLPGRSPACAGPHPIVSQLLRSLGDGSLLSR